jgi:hypothetical protein
MLLSFDVRARGVLPLRLSMRVDLDLHAVHLSNRVDHFIALSLAVLDDSARVSDMYHVREMNDVIRHARENLARR